MPANEPWYRTSRRWGQTNLVEIDPERYDDAWWRRYWRDTRIDGVIVNAGGIVAYYPSEFELHHRAVGISEQNDLYGRIVASARDEGLAVVARMDSNRVAEDFFIAHPEWMARDADGEPYRAADKWITCVNSGYYNDYLLQVLAEITRRSAPDGFADNSWAGLPRDRICYCENCARIFREAKGSPLPAQIDWSDPTYRDWVRWNYDRRVEIWELNNKATQAAGGEHCIWMGMLSGDQKHAANRFNDQRRILRGSPFAMLDHQFRWFGESFHQNAEAGKRIHELVGWDAVMPESMPMYSLGRPAFRVAAMPKAEAQLWSANGFAGGIQPWWHHIGSHHEDRRQYSTAPEIFQWHEKNEDVLFDRTPVADVGVVWSTDNTDFFGRDQIEERTASPYRGAITALVQAGLTYVPVHADDIHTTASRFSVLLLPNVGAMGDAQLEAVREFHAAGGSVVATGETSLFTEDGERRDDYGLADVLGVTAGESTHGDWRGTDVNMETAGNHTYLRLLPARNSDGGGTDVKVRRPARHSALDGFDDTDIVPFGGYLRESRVLDGFETLATFIPRFPIYPPETSWMSTPETSIPALVVSERGESRTVMVLADLDRCGDRDQQPDARALLARVVRWAIGEESKVSAKTPGGVAVNAYAQPGRTIVHLTNSLATTNLAARQDHLYPVGPIEVRITRPEPASAVKSAALRVAEAAATAKEDGDAIVVTVDVVKAHEVVVIDWA
ncbi:alpha-amylase family protein [Ruania alba]|uniref:Beta-galactosidase GanA n=1 Tax=Ruania alba TaxID=648782 RepID=A0A1H5B5B9_9MICO|nr:alpha-amylase family protein [Ruania alba]SED49625.1 Beta-galactosidase GanA [Ruania alba]